MRKLLILLLISLAGFQNLEAQHGTWRIVATKDEIPERNECGLAACNGKLYLVGGDTGEPMAVESYDPTTKMWTKLATAPLVMHHFQAVALNDKIYILDAFSEGGFPNQEPMSNPYIYKTKTNTWSKGTQIEPERRRGGAGAAVYNGKLYLVAGIQHGHSSGTTNMFDEYDPASNTWKTLPNAPHIRDHCAAAVIKDKLYVLGGRNTSYHEPDNFMALFSKTVLDVDCYDFKTGTWSTLSAKLPLGTGGGSAVNFHDILYYIGGERATATLPNGPQKNVYYLDPSTKNTWYATADLNKARNGMAATVLDNRIYVAGGSGGGQGGHPPRKNDGPSSPTPAPNGMPSTPPGGNMHPQQTGKLVLEMFEPGK